VCPTRRQREPRGSDRSPADPRLTADGARPARGNSAARSPPSAIAALVTAGGAPSATSYALAIRSLACYRAISWMKLATRATWHQAFRPLPTPCRPGPGQTLFRIAVQLRYRRTIGRRRSRYEDAAFSVWPVPQEHLRLLWRRSADRCSSFVEHLRLPLGERDVQEQRRPPVELEQVAMIQSAEQAMTSSSDSDFT